MIVLMKLIKIVWICLKVKIFQQRCFGKDDETYKSDTNIKNGAVVIRQPHSSINTIAIKMPRGNLYFLLI